MSSSPHRAWVVDESMFGNTEQVARAVADGLEQEGRAVTVDEVGQAPAEVPADVGLLVLGAPTHAFSMSRASTRADAVRRGAPQARQPVGMREWLSALEPTGDVDVPAAVFDTRASRVRRLPMAAGPRAARILERRGFTLLGRPVGFVVDDVEGPLGEGELERAARWGRHLADLTRSRLSGGSRP